MQQQRNMIKLKKKTHGGDTGEEKDIEKHLRKGIAI